MQMNEPPLPPPEGSRAVAVSGLRARKAFEASDCVAEEVPVALEYNGISHAVMLATPADLEDFARGFSITEGIVDEAAQIRDVDSTRSAEGITLHIDIAPSSFARLKDRRRSMAGRTGCGLCGTDSLADAVRQPPRVADGVRFNASAVTAALQNLRGKQMLLAATGATHAAAWCDVEGNIRLLREDVGRHNALDKLVGALQSARLPAASGFIVVTSRASYEMVHKSAVAGVGLLAAVSGVTALAVEMADKANMALLGFVRGDDFSVYAHGWRLDFPKKA
ncbi:MAG: formate dehydrogenase accessory sulfurtransferase FdhD [Pseudomonadota bacterium]